MGSQVIITYDKYFSYNLYITKYSQHLKKSLLLQMKNCQIILQHTDQNNNVYINCRTAIMFVIDEAFWYLNHYQVSKFNCWFLIVKFQQFMLEGRLNKNYKIMYLRIEKKCFFSSPLIVYVTSIYKSTYISEICAQ